MATERRRLRRWLVPGLVAACGLVAGIVLIARGHPGTGLITFAVVTGYAGNLAYRRGEAVFPIQEVYGSGRRESNHLKAAAMTGDILTLVIVAALLVQSLRGADITALAWLAVVAGVTYLLSVLAVSRSL